MHSITFGTVLNNFNSMIGIIAINRIVLLLPSFVGSFDMRSMHATSNIINDFISKTKILGRLSDWIGKQDNVYFLQLPKKKAKNVTTEAPEVNYVTTFFSIAGVCDALLFLNNYCNTNCLTPVCPVYEDCVNRFGSFSVFNQSTELVLLKNIKDLSVVLALSINTYSKLSSYLNNQDFDKNNVAQTLAEKVLSIANMIKTISPIVFIGLSLLKVNPDIMFYASLVSTLSLTTTVALTTPQ